MVSYQQLLSLVGINLAVVFVLFLVGILWKKATGFMFALIIVCWSICSWYYQLNLSPHIPSGFYREHYFLYMFCVIVYGFGIWGSVMAGFAAAAFGIYLLATGDGDGGKKTSEKKRHDHSPWQRVEADKSVLYMDTYTTSDGREYVKHGIFLERVK